jgi:internalin A
MPPPLYHPRAPPALVAKTLTFAGCYRCAPFVGMVTNLTSLNLAANHLTELPTSMGQLASLTSLVAENNHLAALPDALCECSALTNLHLANNQLTQLPNCISRLSSLKSLQVSPTFHM